MVTSNYCESVEANWCETPPSAAVLKTAVLKMRTRGLNKEMMQIVFKNSADGGGKDDVMKTAFTR